MTLTIDIHTARRFILGKQGLWPGRRWRGTAGTEQAMHAMEYLQLDPLQIVARSHNLALHSRVIDYQLDLWEEGYLPAAQVLRLGWVVGNAPDGRTPLLARGHAP